MSGRSRKITGIFSRILRYCLPLSVIAEPLIPAPELPLVPIFPNPDFEAETRCRLEYLRSRIWREFHIRFSSQAVNTAPEILNLAAEQHIDLIRDGHTRPQGRIAPPRQYRGARCSRIAGTGLDDSSQGRRVTEAPDAVDYAGEPL